MGSVDARSNAESEPLELWGIGRQGCWGGVLHVTSLSFEISHARRRASAFEDPHETHPSPTIALQQPRPATHNHDKMAPAQPELKKVRRL